MACFPFSTLSRLNKWLDGLLCEKLMNLRSFLCPLFFQHVQRILPDIPALPVRHGKRFDFKLPPWPVCPDWSSSSSPPLEF